MRMSEKRWGGEPYFGLGYDWDPDWLLTDRQRELRELLIELCEKEMRANAKTSDDGLVFPRRNLELLGEHGFLALTVPEEYGGLGENHVAYAMVCETIARYGCASTAMCYVMHIGAVNTIMLRPTPELIDKYIRPLGTGKIGTLSYSDPETGSHFWYPISSGAERSNGGFKVRKKASWTTSAGFADFYVVQTTSPEFSGYDDLSVFVIDGEDVQAQPSLWDALGLRGNQSGPIEVPGVDVPGENIVGPVGDGAASNDESVDPWFLIGSSSVWNGIALGAIDIAKRHTTRKRHVDVGLRVADYPTIQDYVGEAVMDTNACRVFTLSVADAMDRATDNNTRTLAPGEFARANYLHWAWQIKFEAAKNTAHVVDKMLHACGGSGHKRDMELERYLRDAKAGWVMGPTNEVLRQFVGHADLFGPESLAGAEETFRATRTGVATVSSAPDGDPVVEGGVPASDLQLEVTRATPRDELAPSLPEPLAHPRLDFEVPRASARGYEVKAGEWIQVIDVKGRQCSDFLAFHWEKLQAGEEGGLDSTTTRSLMGNAYPNPGLYGKFYDQDQVPLVEVVRDTVGRHDTFGLACYAKYYEDMGYFGHVNCTDNFNGELLPYTIEPRKGWPALNLFYNTSFDANNLLIADEPWSRPGDYVLFRALTDLVCLSSACPDDIDPANAWNPTEVHIRVYPAKERFQ